MTDYDGASGQGPFPYAMIDGFTLLLSHGLILLAAWRLLSRPDLDRDIEEPHDHA